MSPSPEPARVVAVVVAYNRAELLAEVLTALARPARSARARRRRRQRVDR